MSEDLEREKAAAARAAAELVADGQRVGLGTGSTVAHLLPALAARGLRDLRCVATSPATASRARELGLPVEDFENLDRLDVAIDGADQVDAAGWLVKGGGGALTREKIVAAAADRFVVIVDHTKVVAQVVAPVPLELLSFGLPATLRAVAPTRLRDVPHSPDGGLIADYQGEVGDPEALARRFETVPGVIDHGLFPPALTSDVLVARGEDVEHRRV
ncbi:MAG TPA: ribose 5-phosphate isomerase A [Solirubrobacteraceae bacterium]